jgi:hypothetical protein
MNQENGLNRFKFPLPDGWVDQSAYLFQGPQVDDQYHNITLLIDRKPQSNDIEEFARPRIDEMLNSLPGAEIVKEETKEHPSGGMALEVVFKWHQSDDKASLRKQVYILYDKMACTFVADFTKKSMKTIGLQVSQMIDSFIPE